MRRLAVFALTTATLAATCLPASAADQLKLTVGQRGNWDTAVSHLGSRAGIFRKHNLELEIVYTSGSGETLQPIVSGSVDIGIAVGTQGAIAAYAKGAPVRIIGAQATGAADYWYAKTSSDIRSLKDTNGRTLAYSSNGSSTHAIARAFVAENNLSAKLTPTGSPPATLTAVMTDQVDVGWASPPFGLKELEDGKIRVVAKATDAAMVRGQTIRVVVANADALARKADAVRRYMDAYRETIAYMYSDNPQVMRDYAEFVGISEALARKVRDDFFPKALIWPDDIKGLDSLMTEAVNLKFIPKPLDPKQIAELVQIQKPAGGH